MFSSWSYGVFWLVVFDLIWVRVSANRVGPMKVALRSQPIAWANTRAIESPRPVRPSGERAASLRQKRSKRCAIRCLTGLIEPEQAGNICSSGFAVLTPKGIPGELLFAYLRLPVICELMDLHTTASMYPAISTTDLMRLPFLLPDDATIKKVKQQITAARAARREAHALLEQAKQAVEIAIEKNEAAGTAMLED